jgi:uncharacterized protein (TIGR03083 family)
MPFIDHHLGVWRRSLDSLITLGEELTEEGWAAPAGRADWCVQDVYAHLIGGERWLLAGAQRGYDSGGWPDRPVLARRGEAAAAVLAELRQVYAQRLVQLAAEPVVPHRRTVCPWGATTTYARQLALRAYDAWVHLAEVRRAVGAPVPADADVCRDLLVDALLPVVRGVPAGSLVRLTAVGDVPLDMVLEIGPAGLTRLAPHPLPTNRPSAHFTAGWPVFAQLGCAAGTDLAGRVLAIGDALLVQVIRNQLFGEREMYLSPQFGRFRRVGHGYGGAMPHHTVPPKLGIVCTYTPRRCGLGTYTADLRQAVSVATDDLEAVVVAIDRDGLTYGDEVIATIRQDVVEDYTAAADALLAADVDVVLIQHEYGIFGGSNGSHVVALARALSERGIPYLVTLHTVLSRPTPGQATTLRALCSQAARITVFTETARTMIVRSGIAAGHQIAVIPHGAPVVLQHPPAVETLRPELAGLIARLRGKPVLTTFGLLSPGKGIDIAIDALATIVEGHPATQYVVAGATHPEVVRHAGEEYRERLHKQVEQFGLDGHVHFVDAFLTEPELSALLHHTTLFVTPYRSPEQICSGALTFGLAAGCPAVSSSYRYAEDMLRYGAGRLVPCGDPDALAAGVLDLLDDPDALERATTAARTLGTRITWPAVAVRVGALVREVLAESAAAMAGAGVTAQHYGPAPALRLDHLERLTDEIGIIQFASHVEPDPSSGYCVDDVARLAVVATDLLTLGRGRGRAESWLRQSIRFLIAAYQPSSRLGRRGMHNLLSYGGTWQDWPHLGDHVGRAIWALGVMTGSSACPEDVRRSGETLLDELVPLAEPLADTGLRAGAYALLGLARGRRPATELAPLLARLDSALRDTCAQAPDWRWYEPRLTYDNGRLAQAMLAAAARVGDDEAAARAVDALDWYVGHVGLAGGMLRCVGNRWHHRDDESERWADDGDEQPIDASACVEALVEAWQYTRDPRYARLAGWAYAWFLGRNRAGARLYMERTGGCCDGLSATGPNENQGAESTLAYYQALLGLVGAGLATLPERIPTGITPERVAVVNRSSAVLPSTAPPKKATTKTTTRTSTTSTTTGTRTRTTESPTDA